MRVLIVDDSAVMRKIVRRTLRQAGFGGHDVEEAENGVEALAKIEGTRPDVILSDWNMPEMSGIELLAELNRRGGTPPFCFITSEATSAMKLQASEAGACGFVIKPFTPESLADALGKVLG